MSTPTNSTEPSVAKYDAGQIQVLKGLEAVRKRPGMYIGSTSERGLHHLVFEVVDNSIDEALAGYADTISVTIHPDNSVTVTDNGRGIPVDIHPTEKMPGVELAMTVLHAGGKFDKNTYKVSGGLHGVGVSVVNALSEQLKVSIKRDGKEWYMDFVRGVTKTKLKTLKDVPKKDAGTTVWFKPDREIFTDLIYRYDTLAMRMRELSFLNKDVSITLRDEREDTKKEETFHAKGGLKEFVQHLNRGRKPLHPDVIYIETTKDDIGIELALQYNDGYNDTTFSFVDNINNAALQTTVAQTGDAFARLGAPAGESHAVDIAAIMALTQADKYIVTGTPNQLVYMAKGTGAPGAGTELLRQDLFEIDGSDVTSTDQVIGMAVVA